MDEMEEQRRMLAENRDMELKANLALQEAGNMPPPAETAEYVREFSEDKSFIYNDDGSVRAGSLPSNVKLDYWGIDNPNFVFSHFKDERDNMEAELLNLSLNIVHSIVRVNHDYYKRKIMRILRDTKITPEDMDTQVKKVREDYTSAILRKRRVTDRINQEIHTFAKVRRAGGEPGAERKSLYTKAVISDRADTGASGNQSLMEKWLGRKKK